MEVFVDRIGHVYGRLTVVSKAGFNDHSSALWNCRCSCGRMKVVLGSKLGNGRAMGCGCLHVRRDHAICGTSSPEFAAWTSMRVRCLNPNVPSYHRYGGRGISVCNRWTNSFASFFSDMGHRPSSKHSIDRIDNDGNYEPSNCRWATKQEQSDNRSVTVWLSVGGVTKTQTQWCRDLGGSSGLIGGRLKADWPLEQALTTPAGQRRTPTP